MSEFKAMQAESKDVAGWLAQLELRFVRQQHRTRLSELSHVGPLRVLKPFYPGEQGECHVYILHPPGGFVGNDRLEIKAELDSGAQVLLTTPAAGKFYQVLPEQRQVQRMKLSVAEGAALAYLPQETIFFGGCAAELQTEFSIAENANLFAWDMLVLGRAASGDNFVTGTIKQTLEVVRNGLPVLKERLIIETGKPVKTQKWGLAGNKVLATAILAGENFSDLLAGIQALVRQWQSDNLDAGVTLKSGIIILRISAQRVSDVKRYFEQLHQFVVDNCDVHWQRPRIWNS